MFNAVTFYLTKINQPPMCDASKTIASDLNSYIFIPLSDLSSGELSDFGSAFKWLENVSKGTWASFTFLQRHNI